MTLRFWSIQGNSQRLDGGAMFGNAPRALWSRWMPPDEQGRIDLACRALLVRESEGRTILFETGVGVFFPPALRERFGVKEAGHVLIESLKAAGSSHDEIDVVVLSHLHFDHAGGLLDAYAPSRAHRLLFPRATFVVGERAFDRAANPHQRDRASFIPELTGLLRRSGRLEMVADGGSETLGDQYTLHFSHGHTPGMMLAEMQGENGPLVFAADLVPGRAWMHLPITMGYDRFPERLIEEKQALFEDLEQRSGRLFLTHDPQVAVAEIVRDERGRFGPGACLESVTGQAL